MLGRVVTQVVGTSVPQEIYRWDGSATLPGRIVELDANDLAGTKHALTNAIHRGQDCVWLEQLLAQSDA